MPVFTVTEKLYSRPLGLMPEIIPESGVNSLRLGRICVMTPPRAATLALVSAILVAPLGKGKMFAPPVEVVDAVAAPVDAEGLAPCRRSSSIILAIAASRLARLIRSFGFRLSRIDLMS